MVNNVPSSATQTPSQRGKIDNISYYCDFTGKTKKANVVLPVGYTTDKKYPVMYVNHGIMGSENDMLSDDMGVRVIAENLARTGEAEEMIIVCANMFTSKTMNAPAGFDQQTFEGYDNFLYDLTDSLMPYIEANYSVATGRENTAITGFSMGGREAIYIGLMRPDLFGYIGGACPAPGIVAASDAFMSHTGSMSESEFKFKDGDPLPYVFMITGGTNDTVVGDFPQQYHNLLTQNGVDHIWQEIQGGGHGGNSVVPHMYNFIKAAFKA
jgi:enterochelin esterase-like enzyme